MNVRPSALITRSHANQTEVLLMHYRYGEADVLALPGGNPDRGETLPQTVMRELREELGISITIGEMAFMGEMFLSERADDVLHVIFATYDWQGEPVLNPAETSALAVQWISISDLGKLNLYPNVGKAI
ncbi:MAG: NUDIX hydrolase, partial [Rudanella sp.]|nr:NUDIX hydrolase [Rudanella sp.]